MRQCGSWREFNFLSRCFSAQTRTKLIKRVIRSLASPYNFLNVLIMREQQTDYAECIYAVVESWKNRFIDFMLPFYSSISCFTNFCLCSSSLFSLPLVARSCHVIVIVFSEFIVSVGSILIWKLWKTRNINFLNRFQLSVSHARRYFNHSCPVLPLWLSLAVSRCLRELCSSFVGTRANLTAHKSS